MVQVTAQMGEDLLGVEEPVVRPSRSEGDGLGVVQGDLVQEVHRVHDRVRYSACSCRPASEASDLVQYVLAVEPDRLLERELGHVAAERVHRFRREVEHVTVDHHGGAAEPGEDALDGRVERGALADLVDQQAGVRLGGPDPPPVEDRLARAPVAGGAARTRSNTRSNWAPPPIANVSTAATHGFSFAGDRQLASSPLRTPRMILWM